jgi:hypothetical protein
MACAYVSSFTTPLQKGKLGLLLKEVFEQAVAG